MAHDRQLVHGSQVHTPEKLTNGHEKTLLLFSKNTITYGSSSHRVLQPDAQSSTFPVSTAHLKNAQHKNPIHISYPKQRGITARAVGTFMAQELVGTLHDNFFGYDVSNGHRCSCCTYCQEGPLLNEILRRGRASGWAVLKPVVFPLIKNSIRDVSSFLLVHLVVVYHLHQH